jgi:hypothetical protein
LRLNCDEDERELSRGWSEYRVLLSGSAWPGHNTFSSEDFVSVGPNIRLSLSGEERATLRTSRRPLINILISEEVDRYLFVKSYSDIQGDVEKLYCGSIKGLSHGLLLANFKVPLLSGLSKLAA